MTQANKLYNKLQPQAVYVFKTDPFLNKISLVYKRYKAEAVISQ